MTKKTNKTKQIVLKTVSTPIELRYETASALWNVLKGNEKNQTNSGKKQNV